MPGSSLLPANMDATDQSKISAEDQAGLSAAVFEWAESYDTKDWDRLRKAIAPILRVDYRAIFGRLWEAMPAEEFIILVSSRALLGDPLLMTQHVVAGTRWELKSPTDAIGYHQIYAPHLKYKDESKTEVLLRGYAHGTNKHWYKKIDGVWKFAGLEPEVRWFEYDFDKMFVFARDLFGSGGHRMAAED